MKKARMNISHSRFILSKLKIFGEIVTTKYKMTEFGDVYQNRGSSSYGPFKIQNF